MKQLSKAITASAAVLSTFAFVALAAPAATAGEYCRTDTSGMQSCGFDTLEQCQAKSSGTGGTCARDPFYKDASNSLAYQPKHGRPAKQPIAH
jgi:hypothetical protein